MATEPFTLNLQEICEGSGWSVRVVGTSGGKAISAWITAGWALSLAADHDDKLNTSPAALGHFILAAVQEHGQVIVTFHHHEPTE